MRKKTLILALLSVGLLLGGLLTLNGEVKAAPATPAETPTITCPKGTLVGDKKITRTKINTLADCNIPEDADNRDLMSVLNIVINVIVGAVGIVAVMMMVIGGITMATSQGDTSKVSKGKNTLIYGIAGLIVAILAFAIVNFVLKGVFG